MARSWIAIGASGLLVAAVAVAVLVGGNPTAPREIGADAAQSDPDAPVTRAEFDELRAALEFERHARSAVAEEVAGLRRALLEARAVEPGRADRAPLSPRAEGALGAGANASGTGTAASTTADAGPGFDTEALVVAGLSDADAERLRARWEISELARLNVNFTGLREGWKGKRFRQEHRALETALRLELGDEWDAYLFATGRENRLRINNVLSDSAAGAAGFEKGDMILSYDSQRIYDPRELQSKAAACADGRFVGVEVVRDGQLDTLRIACGPLGVLVDHVKQPPLVK